MLERRCINEKSPARHCLYRSTKDLDTCSVPIVLAALLRNLRLPALKVDCSATAKFEGGSKALEVHAFPARPGVM